MFRISATGDRADIEMAGTALASMDPTPASAVDTKEDGRYAWRIDAYANSLEEAAGCVGVIELVSPDLRPRYQQLEEKIDWVAKSLEGLPPILAGPFIVGGSHALTSTAPGRTAILIEAGPAFGTGHHGTTLGCLLAYAKIAKRQRVRRVLDLGTGSGVLSIAALKTGADAAIGTDIDADSVAVALENAEKNHVARRFKAYRANGGSLARIQQAAPFDIIFANILAKPLIGLSRDIGELTSKGGHIILSGLLTQQEPLVRQAFAGRGLILKDRIRRDGWSTLVFRRPKPKPQRAKRRSQRAARRASI